MTEMIACAAILDLPKVFSLSPGIYHRDGASIRLNRNRKPVPRSVSGWNPFYRRPP